MFIRSVCRVQYFMTSVFLTRSLYCTLLYGQDLSVQQGWCGQILCFMKVEFTFTKGTEVRVIWFKKKFYNNPKSIFLHNDLRDFRHNSFFFGEVLTFFILEKFLEYGNRGSMLNSSFFKTIFFTGKHGFVGRLNWPGPPHHTYFADGVLHLEKELLKVVF